MVSGGLVVSSRQRPNETPYFVADRDGARDDLVLLPLEVNGTIGKWPPWMRICTAPQCTCQHALLWLVEVTDEASPHPQRLDRILAAIERAWVAGLPCLNLSLDLASGDLVSEVEAGEETGARTLLEQVQKGLLPSQVAVFREHRNRVRAWAKAHPPSRKRWAKFEDLSGVPWSDIFHEAPPLFGVHDGMQYLLWDSYCANSPCTCEEVMISPCARPSGEGPWRSLGWMPSLPEAGG